jgi:hypothetical protein
MQAIHALMRRIAPFLYVRDWYTGAFVLSTSRALLFLAIFVTCVFILLFIRWLGQPVDYTSAV